MPEVRIVVTADGDGMISGMTVTQDDCLASDFCLPGHEAVVDKRVFLDGDVATAIEGLTFTRDD